MRKSRRRTFRISEPHHIDVDYNFGGFNLIFESHEPGGDRHRAIIEMHFCDCAELARLLWKVVHERQKRIDSVTTALKGPN